MKIIATILTAAIVCTVSGCRSAEYGTAPGMSETETGNVEIGKNILDSIKKRDFESFCKAVSEQDNLQSSKDFMTSCKSLEAEHGDISDFKFLTFLKTPPVTNQLWIVDFKARTADGKEIYRQRLFQVLTGDVDGRTRLLGMRFL